MTQRNFNICSYIAAAFVTVTSAITYLLTLESGASFWDCGEFIASSYKLEVGHPPGNPVFQLFARIFTLPFSGRDAAIAVNTLSGLCSAFTILFLYLTIVFLAKRLFKPEEDGSWSLPHAIAIIGSGIVGSLAYAFSDTFWFSAVEGEVYAMSSLFTAMVLWAMTKWYEQYGTPYANRWILLISLLMGLSIGIHLLNLLMIPALVFLYFYRMREDSTYTWKEWLGIFAGGAAVVGLLTFVIIPYLPKVAAYVDLFFVNSLGLPFNSGAVFFLAALFTLGFWGAFKTLRSGKVLANAVITCSLAILFGYSLFGICVIRSAAKTPTNEYQPDNPFTLVRYLSREQYGKTPLLYGQYFGATFSAEKTYYWTPLNGKYIKTEGQPDFIYDASGKMLFPRMHSSSEEHINFYQSYIKKGKAVKGSDYRKPSFADNMVFFFDYQMNWMYWRYFMWNFAGRQNEFHSPAPGDIFKGNWECGISFIDEYRLGDQSDAPDYLRDNKGKNHYYLLPLLLGLIGLCFQFGRDPRGCWIVFLTFFMTGIAIVLYLNQTPFQVRERDYAYAGSFYAFSIWIGFAVAGIYALVEDSLGKKTGNAGRSAIATAIGLLCLGVPALMAEENWDDHDRSNRNTAVEIAANYLNSVGPNGILVTHGDNDTFPVWYAQEVEGIRTDVRVCNTSLLGTDWHIDQMRYACNESSPLPISVPLKQYLYGTNEYVYIVDTRNEVTPIADVMAVFKHPDAKVTLSSGTKVDYICSRKISIPVNKENVIKYGILSKDFLPYQSWTIPDEIVLTMSPNKDYITKQELFMLDLLSGYEWDRPINFLGMGGDINIGIKEYLMYEGFSYKFVPVKTKCKRADAGLVDIDELYGKLMNTYKFDNISRSDYFVDYQNYYTFCGVMSYRNMFSQVASKLIQNSRCDEAVQVLDKCQEIMHEDNYPISMAYLRLGNEMDVCTMIDCYYKAGATQKGHDLAVKFGSSMIHELAFFMDYYEWAKPEFESIVTYLYYLCDDILQANGDKELADEVLSSIDRILPQPEE